MGFMGFILKENHGFTIIEIILVLMLISVIGVVVISKNPSLDVQAAGGRAVIKNHIRYSQILAMKSNTVCGIQFNGSAYWLFRNGSLSDKITLPNNNDTDFSIPSALGAATESVYFDLWGIPYTDAALTAPRPTGNIGSLGITLYMDTGYAK